MGAYSWMLWACSIDSAKANPLGDFGFEHRQRQLQQPHFAAEHGAGNLAGDDDAGLQVGPVDTRLLDLADGAVGGPGRQRGRLDRDHDDVGRYQAGAGDGVVAGRAVDNDPVVNVALALDLFVQVLARDGDDREGLVFAQRGPGVGRGLLVGVDEQDALFGQGEPVGDVERQGGLAGAAFLVEESEYSHG